MKIAKQIVILFLGIALSAVQAEIFRPCPHLTHRCIREVLASNTGCDRNVMGFIANEYTVDEFRFETPHFNCSYIDRHLIVRNHDKCYFSEFFINTRTNRVVLGLTCRNLELESDRVLIQHRTFQEDSYYNYHIHATYPLIRITMTNMNLCSSHVFTDVAALPKMHIDPKDKPTENFLTRDLTALNIFEREAFYYTGDLLAKVYIDTTTCYYNCSRQLLPHYANA